MIALVALGAGLGAVARYLVAQAGKTRWPNRPYATLLVNVVGAFVAGLLTGAALPAAASALLLTGGCGGLTTFSTLEVEALGLQGRRRWSYLLESTGLGLLAVALGTWLGGLL
ncbi:fluoride efflux transporter FluC [Lacticaseibacillus kribbianus]|uniref:fluoride efflux transporter FluC n=1 Tax=Lacticaseibacillus kribbianus TaxID=2926292 RepID=UPI001CD4E753